VTGYPEQVKGRHAAEVVAIISVLSAYVGYAFGRRTKPKPIDNNPA
jgi:hypothetical protein